MSEFEISPTLHCSQPLPPWDLSLPLKRIPSSLSLMRVILSALLPLQLVSALLLSPDFIPRSGLPYKSPLVVIQPSFPLPIFAMLSISSPLRRQKLLFKWPNLFQILSINLSAKHRKARLDFAYAHRDWTLEDWKLVIWSDETKINRLGSYGRKWAWKSQERGSMTDWYKELSSLVEVLWWCGAVWPGKELAMLLRLMVGWMGIFTFKFWRMNFRIPWSFIILILLMSSFSKTMTLSIPAKRSGSG